MVDVIIYTGEGGTYPNTGRQIADQQRISEIKRWQKIHLNGFPFALPSRQRLTFPTFPEDFDIAMMAFKQCCAILAGKSWADVSKLAVRIERP